MRQRVVELDLPSDLSDALAKAVTAYAHAAFPEGGSECAQVSREALLDTAKHCREHRGGTIDLRKRQLPQLRAAVNWYFTDIEPGSPHAGQLRDALSLSHAP